MENNGSVVVTPGSKPEVEEVKTDVVETPVAPAAATNEIDEPTEAPAETTEPAEVVESDEPSPEEDAPKEETPPESPEEEEEEEETGKRVFGVNPQTNLKPFKMIEEKNIHNSAFFPTGTYKMYKRQEARMQELETMVDGAGKPIKLKMSEISQNAIFTSVGGNDVTLSYNLFTKNLHDATNVVEHDGNTIGIRAISVKSDKEQVRGRKAVLRMAKSLGLSDVIQIPLYHSGFSITLQPLSQTDLTMLETTLAKKEIEAGRETNGLVYSNEDVLFKGVIAEFITEHLESTSIALDGEDLLEYIKVQDFDTILLGITRSMYPEGHSIVRACNNTLKLDNNGNTKCTYQFNATVDPAKLLWVRSELLTDEHFKQMTKTKPASVTIDEVVEYQESLSVNKPYTFEHEGNTYELQSPSVRKHIDMGELWINRITHNIDSIISADSDTAKADLFRQLADADGINRYGHLIKSVSSPEAIIEEDYMEEFLKLLANDEEAKRVITEKIMRYINQSYLAVAGIPVYKCPSCRQDVEGEEEAAKGFEEIIPLNIYRVFFALIALRLSARTQQTEFMF